MKQITKYKCDFCKRSYMSKYKAREHENKCFFNPAVKSCVTCRHEDIKSTFDEEGNCIDVISWCFAMERVIFWKGYPIKHCTGWQGKESEVEHDLELPEMPESCWKCKYCTIFDVCSILSKRGKSDTYAIVPGEGRHKDCPLKLVEGKEGEDAS